MSDNNESTPGGNNAEVLVPLTITGIMGVVGGFLGNLLNERMIQPLNLPSNNLPITDTASFGLLFTLLTLKGISSINSGNGTSLIEHIKGLKTKIPAIAAGGVVATSVAIPIALNPEQSGAIATLSLASGLLTTKVVEAISKITGNTFKERIKNSLTAAAGGLTIMANTIQVGLDSGQIDFGESLEKSAAVVGGITTLNILNMARGKVVEVVKRRKKQSLMKLGRIVSKGIRIGLIGLLEEDMKKLIDSSSDGTFKVVDLENIFTKISSALEQTKAKESSEECSNNEQLTLALGIFEDKRKKERRISRLFKEGEISSEEKEKRIVKIRRNSLKDLAKFLSNPSS